MEAHVSAQPRSLLFAAAIITTIAPLTASVTVVGATPKTKLASKDGLGNQLTEIGENPAVNYDGKLVTFDTEQNVNDAGDGNFQRDAYLRNIKAGTTKIVSVSSSEKLGNGQCKEPDISDFGRFVAFESSSTNPIDGWSVPARQIYLRDRKTGKTSLTSKGPSGPGNGTSWSPDLSAGGRFVTFESNAKLTSKPTNGVNQIYLRDRKLGKTILVSRNNSGKSGNGNSFDPAISQGGRYVVCESEASNLVSKSNRGYKQIYRYDRVTKKTALISKNRWGKAGNGPSEDPAISDKGAVIVYESDASNLVANDHNGFDDIFMRKGGKTKRVSLNYLGRELKKGGGDGAEDPDISYNGRWLVFESDAANATRAGHSGGYEHIYLRDLKTGKLTLVSRSGAKIANGESGDVRVSGDGRFVVFGTHATNLLPTDRNDDGWDIIRRGPYR